MFRRVLCSLSLEGPQEASLQWALQFADAFHAGCDAIHVSRDGSGTALGKTRVCLEIERCVGVVLK